MNRKDFSALFCPCQCINASGPLNLTNCLWHWSCKLLLKSSLPPLRRIHSNGDSCSALIACHKVVLSKDRYSVRGKGEVCGCFTTEVFALELGRSCVSLVVIRCVKLLVENRAVVSVISEEWMVLGFRATISVFLEIYGWVGVIGYDSIFCPPSTTTKSRQLIPVDIAVCSVPLKKKEKVCRLLLLNAKSGVRAVFRAISFFKQVHL